MALCEVSTLVRRERATIGLIGFHLVESRYGPLSSYFALSPMPIKRIAAVLLFILLLEAILVVSLRWLGWYGTGSAVQYAACLFVTALPLLAALAVLLHNGMQFSLRSILTATFLVAVFLTLSLAPLVRHRAARQTSMRLLVAGATVNQDVDWDSFYSQVDLDPAPKVVIPRSGVVPPWLKSFTKETDAIPPDDAVRNVWLNNDRQCRIFAANWKRLPSLQSVSISRGVSSEGLQLLQDVLARFKHLDSVHTNDVSAPPRWYGSLTNIRTLWVWGEGASLGKPFDQDHLDDIASLSNIEMLMVLGYAFDDNDARELAASKSIRRVLLRNTAVTPAGESDLANATRIVYRN